MLKNELMDLLEQFDYPQESRDALCAAFDRLADDPAFEELLKGYEADMRCDFNAMRPVMKELSAKAGVHEYTGNLLLMLGLSKSLKRYSAEASLEEEVWRAVMNDLKWKMAESKEIYDVWGTFVPEWYPRFFRLERFGFGRLQFELISFGREYHKNGLNLQPDSPVINVHIPRTGGRLDRESMLSAYAQAAEFFKDACGENGPVFVCRSWLLFPRNREACLGLVHGDDPERCYGEGATGKCFLKNPIFMHSLGIMMCLNRANTTTTRRCGACLTGTLTAAWIICRRTPRCAAPTPTGFAGAKKRAGVTGCLPTKIWRSI